MNLDTRTELVRIVREVAKAEILPRFRQLSRDDISAKSGPEDLVTEADVKAEAAISARVKDLMPDAMIVLVRPSSANRKGTSVLSPVPAADCTKGPSSCSSWANNVSSISMRLCAC